MPSFSAHSIWMKIRLAVGLLVLITAAVSSRFWYPAVSQFVDSTIQSAQHKSADSEHADSHDDHSDHSSHEDGGHAHAGHDESSSLELSSTALRNLGLTSDYLKPISPGTFFRSITVPAIVAARPGRTQIEVSTPLTGVVTHVHAVTGETVTPGTLLFEIRLTHEELVTAQTDFLRTLGELEVEKLEVARLESVAESGAISGRSLLERKYARDRLEAHIRAQREALRLHGLSDRQIDEIATQRKLLMSLSVVTPEIDTHDHKDELRLSNRPVTPVSYSLEEALDADHPLAIGDLRVRKGQSVQAGETLCVVSDLEELFIEGQAFEQDGPALTRAIENGWTVTAIFPGEPDDEIVTGLPIAFVGNEVDSHARTLPCFVHLQNSIVRDQQNESGQRFVSWKYRPGQRLQLRIPVEEWKDQIVVPVDAVVQEGADWYVFQQNGSHFDRVAVHVIHRDSAYAVIANDGSVFPGDVIALKSAHQMQMALKNKSGAGADPHAGHSH